MPVPVVLGLSRNGHEADRGQAEGLLTAAFEDDNKPGQSAVERMAIPASLKVMKEMLANKLEQVA